MSKSSFSAFAGIALALTHVTLFEFRHSISQTQKLRTLGKKHWNRSNAKAVNFHRMKSI